MVVAQELTALTFQGHFPSFQDVAVIGNGQRLIGILLDEQDGGATRPDVVNDAENLLHQFGRQPQRGLVEENEPGSCHQRPTDGQHLLLPTAQGTREL